MSNYFVEFTNMVTGEPIGINLRHLVRYNENPNRKNTVELHMSSGNPSKIYIMGDLDYFCSKIGAVRPDDS